MLDRTAPVGCKFRRVAAAVLIIAMAATAASAQSGGGILTLPFDNLDGQFSSFNIPVGTSGETIPSGPWHVQQVGTGVWDLDFGTMQNFFIVPVMAHFPELPGAPSLSLVLTETGPFSIGRDVETGLVGIWGNNQASLDIVAPGTPLHASKTEINNKNDISLPRLPIPPFPAAPEPPDIIASTVLPPEPDPLPLPPGFEPLAPGEIPTLDEFSPMGIYALTGIVQVPGIPEWQEYRGRGLFDVLVGPPPLTGDANGDGQVDGNDLISVEENFGATGPAGIPGDANGDGQVDGNDLISVEENFGATAGGNSIPEPASMLLLAIGVGAVSGRRRRA